MRKTVLALISFALVATFSSCDKDEVIASGRQKYAFESYDYGFARGGLTLVGDYLYIGTSSAGSDAGKTANYFFKFDKQLNVIWQYSLGHYEVMGNASLDANGNIYFIADTIHTANADVSEKFMLYSLDNNGNFRWSRSLGWGQRDEDGAKNIAISADNTIYAGVTNLSAFDTDGNIHWTYANTRNHISAPIIDPTGNIYFASEGVAISLDASGKERWRTVAYGITLAFTTDYSHVIAADATVTSIATSTGAISWKYTIPNVATDAFWYASPVVDDNNNVYIANNTTLYAIKADGTGLLWQFIMGSGMQTPTLGNNRILYIGGSGGNNTGNNYNRFHAFDMSSGKLLWSAQLGKDISCSAPVLAVGGIAYVQTMYVFDYNHQKPGGIYAFQTESTAGLLPNCGSPTFQESNAHTGRR